MEELVQNGVGILVHAPARVPDVGIILADSGIDPRNVEWNHLGAGTVLQPALASMIEKRACIAAAGACFQEPSVTLRQLPAGMFVVLCPVRQEAVEAALENECLVVRGLLPSEGGNVEIAHKLRCESRKTGCVPRHRREFFVAVLHEMVDLESLAKQRGGCLSNRSRRWSRRS